MACKSRKRAKPPWLGGVRTRARDISRHREDEEEARRGGGKDPFAYRSFLVSQTRPLTPPFSYPTCCRRRNNQCPIPRPCPMSPGCHSRTLCCKTDPRRLPSTRSRFVGTEGRAVSRQMVPSRRNAHRLSGEGCHSGACLGQGRLLGDDRGLFVVRETTPRYKIQDGGKEEA